ncbi:MAG: hypothetical protein OQJ99_08170 [Rhodospirillales bacterium]|nr:hypothetical protein [Rhodospirillales bacterium]MCW8862811.1 hypothetical protein [Rhodospirillales bacterium]MCW8951900.1 hypothetical protein [Rhodospirillales bacterium]MCW8970655.1 hypothetical protein [Rhodospirillales bacterium]MCW9002902.1 hypothetical protein [Rhodospirillales bacterium]
MDDYDIRLQTSKAEGGADNITLFLGLYLLILAFFILLVSISTVEEIKTKAVMDSLTSTFSSILPPSAEQSAFTGRTGEVVAGQQFQEQIAGVFASAVQVARVTVVQPGRQMRVVLPTQALFVDEDTKIREAQYQLLDRLVAALSQRPPGLYFEMEFIIGSAYAAGKGLPIAQTLETARAGAFAREMRGRGAPPESVVLGLKAGDPQEITMFFNVRSTDEEPLRFDSAVAR